MITRTSISDPQILFERWFNRPIAQLEKLENGDGGTAGMMIVLPLFERYIDILEMGDTSGRKWYEIMAAELHLATDFEAKKFWTTLRHGFCHTGMPLERGQTIKDLPKPRFAEGYPSLPQFSTTSSGEEIVSLDPWKFIQYVMDIYRRDPTLLIQHPDAPLMGIHEYNSA